MNIVFIADGKYPDQSASAIRHSTIAQGLREVGNNVVVLVLGKQDWNKTSIIYNSVTYSSICKYFGSNKLLNKIFFWFDLQQLNKTLIKLNNRKGIDAIICYSIKNPIIHKTLDFCRKNNVCVFHERTELPTVVGHIKSRFGKKKLKMYLNTYVPKFNGVFVISNRLEEFFKDYNSNIKKIPTVVDTRFFSVKETPILKFPYVAYCGTMHGAKDGVHILIEAFAKLIKHCPHYKLLLIGQSKNKQQINNLLASIKSLGIEANVVFTGFIKRKEMPNYLGNAKLLVVSKPDNEQNSGNFPIKVGEYLATGVPVVLTKVGEIPDYVQDGVSGFLATPGSAESFYKKMTEALDNYGFAKKVGLKGKEVAQQNFEYTMQASEVEQYIRTILATKNEN